jgi:hypothetical protein
MSKLPTALIIVLFCSTTCCSQKKIEFQEIHNWQGGAIRKAGIYHYKDKNILLKVYIENKLLKYQMLDGHCT